MGAVAAGGNVGLAEEGVVERDLAVAAVELPGAVVDGVGGVVEEGVGDVESAVADADVMLRPCGVKETRRSGWVGVR